VNRRSLQGHGRRENAAGAAADRRHGDLGGGGRRLRGQRQHDFHPGPFSLGGARRRPDQRCTQTFKKTWGACPVKQVDADKIEAQVLNVLDELSLAPELIRHVEAANTTCSDAKAL
jgi:hypothetical protein